MRVNELRIGNLVKSPMGNVKVGGVIEGKHPYIIVKDSDSVIVWLRDCEPIRLTEDILLKCGFKNIPHFTVTDSKTLDIGRGRNLSIGDAENCNQMMFIQSIHSGKITDLVCVHNYDYNGWLYLHQLQNLYFALTGEELKIEL